MFNFKKIPFVNGKNKGPAINAQGLNQIQTNVKNAMIELEGNLVNGTTAINYSDVNLEATTIKEALDKLVSMNVYSENDETIIGYLKHTDGTKEAIYRKEFDSNLAPSTTETKTLASIEDLKNIRNMNATAKTSQYQYVLPLTTADSFVYVFRNGNNLVTNHTNNTWNNTPVHVILEYTKNTESGQNNTENDTETNQETD